MTGAERQRKNYIKGDRTQKLAIVMTAIFCVFFIFFSNVFGVGGVYAAAETDTESGIMQELSGLKIDGKEFSKEDYPADKNGTPYVLAVQEVGYSFYVNKRQAYGLNIYVYNPLQLAVLNDVRNTVQIKAGAAARYDKYRLSVVSVSSDKLFYKFAVKFTEQEKAAVLSALDKENRVYEISSIELYTTGENATDYGLSHTQIFTFTGYSAGLGQAVDSESTLASTLSYTIAGGISTEKVKVHHASWRPSGTNGNSEYTQDTIHSVYFAVPKKIAAQYDYLHSVKAEWYEARTAPILVTGNMNVMDAFVEPMAKALANATVMGTGLPDVIDYNSSKWCLISPAMYENAYSIAYEVFCGSDYWYKNFTDYDSIQKAYQHVNNRIGALYMIGYTERNDLILTAEEVESVVKEAAQNIGRFGLNDEKVAGKYPSGLFESYAKTKHTEIIEVGKTDKELLLNSETVEHKWWQKIFGGSTVTNQEQFKGIKAIEELTDGAVYGGSDKERSDRLYVAERDLQDLQDFYENHKSDSTVYLMRYAVSEYYRAEVRECEDIWGGMNKERSKGYIAKSNCYFDFDILDFDYVKEDKHYILPVVMSPVDIFTPLTPPPTFQGNDDFWKYAVGTMAGLTVFYAVYKMACEIYEKSRRGL